MPLGAGSHKHGDVGKRSHSSLVRGFTGQQRRNASKGSLGVDHFLLPWTGLAPESLGTYSSKLGARGSSRPALPNAALASLWTRGEPMRPAQDASSSERALLRGTRGIIPHARRRTKQ
jgi:hypothetical protein